MHTKSYKLNDNKLTVYISTLNSEKKISGCQMKEKKSCLRASPPTSFEACRSSFKPCHQPPLKAK